MQIALEHYYANNNPFGEYGDFITAPVISQMFGEIIGVWSMNTFSKLNLGKFSLVEIGGGARIAHERPFACWQTP